MSGAADAALLAEQCVLGGLLLDNSARARLNGLSGEHFSIERHRTIYEAILDQIEDGEQGAADAVTVWQRLQRAGKADEAGGLAYLNGLAANTPGAANVAAYAAAVGQHAAARQLRAVLDEALKSAERGDAEAARRLLQKVVADAPPVEAAALPRLIDLQALADDPPPPRFIVPVWLPQGEVTLFAGHGGTGKSAIALYLAVCVALGRPFFGMPTERRRVLLLSLEDAAAVLHWRIARLSAWIGFDIADLARWLTIVDGTGADAELLAETKHGAALTHVYEWLRQQMHGAEVLIVDGASDAYGASEIDRRHVRMFLRAVRRLIPASGAAVLLAHVDKASARAGDTSQGYSGSTAWSNSVRARWYLRPDETRDGLLLELQKANLAPAGAQIAVRWNPEYHVFAGECELPAGRLDRAVRDSDERAAVLALIRAAAASGNPLPAAASGQRTAHSVAEARDDCPGSLRGKAGRARFYRHVEALRAAGSVRVEAVRKANRHAVEVLRAAL
ncbi:MAG: AAA family ATPase [Burkholderiales bacterium]|nr:AAA family ATPase [Burkholderiales bacterium]